MGVTCPRGEGSVQVWRGVHLFESAKDGFLNKNNPNQNEFSWTFGENPDYKTGHAVNSFLELPDPTQVEHLHLNWAKNEHIC